LNGISHWQAEMGTYYDGSYCGNDALHYEPSSAKGSRSTRTPAGNTFEVTVNPNKEKMGEKEDEMQGSSNKKKKKKKKKTQQNKSPSPDRLSSESLDVQTASQKDRVKLPLHVDVFSPPLDAKCVHTMYVHLYMCAEVYVRVMLQSYSV